MTTRTIEQQIAEQQAKLAKLRKKLSAEDTQRKIIIGALMLKAAEQDANVSSFMHDYLSNTASERDLERLKPVLDSLLEVATKEQTKPIQQQPEPVQEPVQQSEPVNQHWSAQA
ncbi:hypothetical protein [Marinospirillum sp.]|uniref:hypothetical protein n=1 Tax=Marinospirillum sp. TaxID=2183934 RepID=UPI003A86514A